MSDDPAPRKRAASHNPPGTISIAALAAMFGMSPAYTFRNLKEGPTVSGRGAAVDLRRVKDVYVGPKHRFIRASALALAREYGFEVE